MTFDEYSAKVRYKSRIKNDYARMLLQFSKNHVDHKCSIHDCFYAGLTIEEASHPLNLEITTQEYNWSKGRRSTLSPYQLRKAILESEALSRALNNIMN